MHLCAPHTCLIDYPDLGLQMLVTRHVGSGIEPRSSARP